MSIAADMLRYHLMDAIYIHIYDDVEAHLDT